MSMELTQAAQPINASPFAIAEFVMKGMRAAFAAYARAKWERRAIRTLQMLDDRMLADIGVARAEIAVYVREAEGMKARA